MAALAEPALGAIEQLLADDEAKDLLRFTTAGSVDDGKSTLIGRLLYDSRNVLEDHIRSVAKASAARGNGALDLSLLTDGLRAEREQGITIDVAYRYFATARRKFIIADTPGHEQYTRNMATGASTADLAIVLIDARNGVLPQSRRHAAIAALLGIPHLVVAVNKMDAVGYDEARFRAIEREFTAFLAHLGRSRAYFLPISALVGDNVVERSSAMSWFDGPSLLEHLESVEVAADQASGPLRMPVQYVIRPNQDFRGYAGPIASGAVRPGDEVLALPSGRRSRVRALASFDGFLPVAHAPMAATVTLEDDIDIGRGDMLVSWQEPPRASRLFRAHVVWMSETPLDRARPLLVKHTAQTVPAEIAAVEYRSNITTLEQEPAEALALNEIGVIRVATAKPLFFDPYASNRPTGCFVLIDAATNATVAAGMIIGEIAEARKTVERQKHALDAVTPAERMALWRHAGAVVRYGDRVQTGIALERLLFERGAAVVRLDGTGPAATSLASAGLLVLLPGDAGFALPSGDEEAAHALVDRLARDGVVLNAETLTEGEGI